MTAFIAFVTAFLFATCVAHLKLIGIVLLLVVIVLIIMSNHKKHRARAMESEETEILNLRKVKDPKVAISITFDHLAVLIKGFQGIL